MLVALALAGLAGCLTSSRKPASVFDEPAAAEPSGLRRFLDFRPSIARLEVAPTQPVMPPKGKQLVVATVYGRDGQPSTRRRVEWSVSGPGTILTVDDAGLFFGGGLEAKDKAAYSYTASHDHTVPRTATGSKEEITIRPGQTWCVVTCDEVGETTVTATAADGEGADAGRMSVKLTWADEAFTFPRAAVAPAGGQVDLTTVLHKLDGKDDGLKVRYRVVGGVPATLAGAAGGEKDEAEVTADAGGKAAVRLLQTVAKAGTTRVAVEVVKPDPKGLSAGTVVGRKETTVEWAAARLTIDAQAPKLAVLDRDAPFTITVANAGRVDSLPVTAHATLPGAAEFVSADPPPAVRQDRNLTWNLGAIAGGKNRTITVTLRPTRKEALTLAATAETADTNPAEVRASAAVDSAGLKVALEVPDAAGTGERVPVTVAVTNPAGVPVENVTAWLTPDAGLAPESGKSPVEVAVGTVPPGQTKRVDVQLAAKQPGRYAVRVNVAADGGLTDRAEVGVDVRKSSLFVNIVGPDKLTVGQDATFTLTVTNTGDVALDRVEVRATPPPGLTVRTADKGKVADAGATWAVGQLKPKDKQELHFVAVAAKPMTRQNLSVKATGAAGSGANTTGAADAGVTVTGQPALTLELADVPGAVPVGGRAAVRITVRNRGTDAAKHVEVSVTTTEPFNTTGGTGADRRPGQVDGQKVTFGTLEELQPGTAAVFVVDLEAAKAGPARVLAEVRADYLAQPLREEQAARVVNKP